MRSNYAAVEIRTHFDGDALQPCCEDGSAAAGSVSNLADFRPESDAREGASADHLDGFEYKLMWPIRDNGSDLNQQQASDYCRDLSLAGFKDVSVIAIYDYLLLVHAVELDRAGSGRP
jgi:hypothetical protein